MVAAINRPTRGEFRRCGRVFKQGSTRGALQSVGCRAEYVARNQAARRTEPMPIAADCTGPEQLFKVILPSVSAKRTCASIGDSRWAGDGRTCR